MPYYQPVAPELADAQKNKAPELMLQGFQQGFAAIAEINRQRRQTELALREMAQKDQLAAQEHQLEREKQAQDYEIKKEHNKLLGVYYNKIGTTAQNTINAKAQADLARMAEHNRQLAHDTSVIQYDDKALSEAQKLGLHDAEFWAREPVLAADKYMDWRGKYGNSIEGIIPQRIKEWDAKADLTKLAMRPGAQWVPDTETPEGKMIPGHFRGGHIVHQPAWQVLQKWKYASPEERARIQQDLAAAGNMKTVDHLKKVAGEDVIVHSVELDPTTRKYLNQAEKAKLLPGENQIPPELQTKFRKNRGVEDTTTPAGQTQSTEGAMPGENYSDSIPTEADTPVLPDTSSAPTQTDINIEHARRVLAVNPGARDEVFRRLRDMGINPALVA